MDWDWLAIPFFLIIVGIAIICAIYSKRSNEKYDQFFENVERIIKGTESCYTKFSKTDVISYMKPYLPSELSDKQKEKVEMFGDDYLVYHAFNANTTRSGWTMTTSTSVIWIVFYFINNELVGIKNLTTLLEN